MPTSCLVYQLDLHTLALHKCAYCCTTYISMIAPGKNGASTKPRKKRARTNPVNDCVAA